MTSADHQLEQELQVAGAQPGETTALVELAEELRTMPAPARNWPADLETILADRRSIARMPAFRWLVPALLGLAIFGSGSVTVLLAEQSLPGERLYPVKEWYETQLSSVVPSYKDDLVVRRSQEIERAVETKKDAKTFDQTVTNYQATVDKTDAKPPKKVEESVGKVKQAEEKASEHERSRLEETVKRVDEKLAKDQKETPKTTPPTSEPTSSSVTVSPSTTPSVPSTESRDRK